jgi:formylglycine-generating enzyme required for sulfatase activity
VSKWFKWLYLTLVFAAVAVLWVGISRTGRVPGQASEGAGYRPIATKIEEARAIMTRAEAHFAVVKVDPEFDRMASIPAGPFNMGDRRGGAIEQPERAVTLSAYQIDVYETTFAQYYAFVKATGHRKPRLYSYPNVETEPLPFITNPMSPVVGVAWEDALAYCIWRGKRLPTEAEWERAAKGGERRSWPWGDEANPRFANLVGDEDGFRYSAPVGGFRQDKSPEGVYDMAGNVMEWTADWFNERYYAMMSASNPPGPSSGTERVVRGGSWNDSMHRAKTTTRFKIIPDYHDITVGFRCVKSPGPPATSHTALPELEVRTFPLDTSYWLPYNAAVLSRT